MVFNSTKSSAMKNLTTISKLFSKSKSFKAKIQKREIEKSRAEFRTRIIMVNSYTISIL